MGKVKDAYLSSINYIWEWEEDEEDLPPAIPDEVKNTKEKTIDDHKGHDVVKNYVCPYGKQITFYYCRDCKVEV